MAVLEILHFPDPRLRTVAKPVAHVDVEIGALVDAMFETMYRAPGIGLAATQVDVHQRIVVIDVSEERNQPVCLINPEIVEIRGSDSMEEGCLSVPDIFETVTRANWVRVTALGADGVAFECVAEGLLAACIQHEIDHLDGKLFVDRLSALKRTRINKKFRKNQRSVG
ncbi:MAG: peptide deformylase [Gammaproteobacteria bacterium]|nr:peptide deformylase [Gammaproteobacteria bacterium]